MRLNHRLLSSLTLLSISSSHVSSASGGPPYSIWMADSMIAHGVSPTRWYNEAFFSRAIEAVYSATSLSTYRLFITSQIDGILNSDGSIRGWESDHQLDNIRVGSAILYLYTLTGSSNQKYKTAADFLYDQLVNQQKRTASGGFWHKDPKYPNQMWLDGLYMAEPFYAQYTTLFSNSSVAAKAWDDIVLQFDLVEKHCRNSSSGMLYHGYDESLKATWANKKTGASPHVWDRAQGWYLMALVDVLDWFPVAHSGRERLMKYLTSLAQALKVAQDKASGGWWLVMDEPYPGQKGNYIESSGTAMYTYGLLKGVRKGYLDAKEFVSVAERAYGCMLDKFVARNGTNGTLNWEGTYYTTVPVVENSLLGVSPFVLASVEMEAYNKARS
ncbi:putative cell wall glycosyl hydrolase YteR [Apodospora peruviana]|uniref:Cell wall glycosyl hydrolase YteR n=1 Tax=Apodospora peruviana TaxID=516989 RepID=A0AAE0M060_9PEZI|nr:putative cell wall glycosyl hydrolase YteR [Apodospora peruviana]